MFCGIQGERISTRGKKIVIKIDDLPDASDPEADGGPVIVVKTGGRGRVAQGSHRKKPAGEDEKEAPKQTPKFEPQTEAKSAEPKVKWGDKDAAYNNMAFDVPDITVPYMVLNCTCVVYCIRYLVLRISCVRTLFVLYGCVDAARDLRDQCL